MRNKTLTIVGALLVLVFVCGCNSDECGNCGGGVEDGYFFKRVTSDDLLQLSSDFPDMQLEQCIRFKFDVNDEFDLETVTLVDDCCCDLY